jgi:hypothetical protein
MIFKCVNTNETWKGTVTSVINYGSHYEIKIQSRSSIIVLVGKTSLGTFACIPDFSAGCHLANLKDLFYSKEKLCEVMNKVDGITVAYALAAIADKLDLKQAY